MARLSPPQRDQRGCHWLLTLRLEQDSLIDIELKANAIETRLPRLQNHLSGMLWHAKDCVINIS
eukprot:3687453-Amphidinium_carterae.5